MQIQLPFIEHLVVGTGTVQRSSTYTYSLNFKIIVRSVLPIKNVKLNSFKKRKRKIHMIKQTKKGMIKFRTCEISSDGETRI